MKDTSPRSATSRKKSKSDSSQSSGESPSSNRREGPSARRHQQHGKQPATRKATDKVKRHRTWLIYGKSGTGKTTLAGSFPKPALLIDIKDEGDESVEDVEGLDIFEPNSLEEVEAMYWWLKFNPTKYKTVIIDTVTQLQAMIVAEISAQKSKAKYAGKKSPGSWGTMTKQQWGTAADICKTQIMNFRALPMHTVFLAQEKLTDPDDASDDGVENVLSPEVGPALMKSVAGFTCSASSFIGHTFIRSTVVKKKLRKERKEEYCLRVGPNPVYITKVRKPKSVAIPAFIVDPTYESIMKLAKGK